MYSWEYATHTFYYGILLWLSIYTVDSTGSFYVISTIYNSTKQGSALRCIEVFQMAQFRMGMWCLQSPFRNGHLYGSGIFGTERLIVWFQCCAAVLHWILLYGISDWSVEGTSNHQGCPPYRTTNRVSGVFFLQCVIVTSDIVTVIDLLKRRGHPTNVHYIKPQY